MPQISTPYLIDYLRNWKNESRCNHLSPPNALGGSLLIRCFSFFLIFFLPTPNPLPAGKRALRFASPCIMSSSRMRGSILCSLYLWIPAYAGMTGASFRNPVPELVEGAHLLSSTVAYTSGSERFVLFCIIVIQGKIIPKLFKLLPKQ